MAGTAAARGGAPGLGDARLAECPERRPVEREERGAGVAGPDLHARLAGELECLACAHGATGLVAGDELVVDPYLEPGRRALDRDDEVNAGELDRDGAPLGGRRII